MEGARTVLDNVPLEQDSIEQLMDAAWPACEREDAGPWVLRASDGVTQRANSVWPRHLDAGAPETEVAAAVRHASTWYRDRRLPLIFQVFDDDRSAGLNDVLDGLRFTRQSATQIMVRGTSGLPSSGDGRVELSRRPSEEWLRLWWSVDGRGGEPELEVARRILTGCPSVYALVRDDGGQPAAVGRLAVTGGWGGIYGMATSEAHRRRGYATLVLDALLGQGAKEDLKGFWLLVTAANHGAQSLYRRAGFTDYGSYLYRQAPLRRASSGC
ncbi:GNAT family N-acetyltransferase [Paenarthrobacter sp. NPDC089989]|uniref:GNAT family N-acetyltransferase n=1 Tax=unclassified Paenarthrobacter TaxID=2634190 RepID=UPI0037FF98DC